MSIGQPQAGGKINLTVWVDADSCPAVVRDLVVDITQNRDNPEVNVVFSANREIPYKTGGRVGFNLSSKEKESTDNFIISSSQPGDIVLTKDFLLAVQTVDRKICTMNFDGRVFDAPWLKKRIEERNMMQILYNSGSIDRYRKKSRNSSQNNDFTLSFSRELNKILSKGE